jgi:hypothetical protein
MNLQNFLRKTNNRDTFSQACQDLFVLDMLENKKNGFYLEIGASHPFESNNTFLLENQFFWRGLSLEIDDNSANIYNNARLNKCMLGDATNFEYKKSFVEMNVPLIIDYLSIDIEPAENTFKALLQIPLNEYRFRVITYEHDRYVSGDIYMNKSRSYLESFGYKLIVSNVKSNGRDFEDWWVDPQLVKKEIWENYIISDIEFKDILFQKSI